MKNFKKILLMGVSYVLIAALAIGGTLAYLQDSDEAVNVMTLGNVSIEQHEYERATNADGTYKTDTIDGVTSYVLKKFTQGKPLLPIVGDPSLPGDNAGYAGYDSIPVRMSQVDSYGGMQVFAGKNAQDKFVTVENTGKTDAYIRTLVAIEVGTADPDLISFGNHLTWEDNEIGTITIDGNNYYLHEFTYTGGKHLGGQHEKGILPAGETSYPSLCQVYLKHNATNEDMVAIDGNGNGTLDILVVTQAIQVAGFADAETALNAGFGDITTTNHPWSDKAPAFSVPKNDAEFENALKDTTSKQIIVNLTGDVTYDVAAWASDAMGGAATEYIMINGNGYTITFNQKDSDWNNIVTNGAKLIINNAKITNAGYNDGPWNRHDLNFACDVELNNVVSDKALAFKAGATLNNVTISDANTSDTYAIWIQPNGQTVTLDNCVIDMLACTDGRGIKIDDQYLGAGEAKKVTLNVSNTTFKTEEKSAIIVKTPAGAEINLDNVDIAGVAADPIHEVWVDEASASYADLVVVNGGKKAIEGTVKVANVSNNAELKAAIEAGNTEIWLNPGKYNAPAAAKGKTLAIYGTKDAILEVVPAGQGEANGQLDYNFDGSTVTFDGITIKTNNQTYAGYARLTGTYNNCTMENSYCLNNDSVFNDCTLNVSGDQYSIWTWGAPNATFNGCTFNSDGKALILYGTANTKLTVNNCVFNDTGVLPDLKAAIEIGNDYGKTYELIVNNTVVNGYEINDKGINTNSTLWANKNSMGKDKLNVVIDGVDVY